MRHREADRQEQRQGEREARELANHGPIIHPPCGACNLPFQLLQTLAQIQHAEQAAERVGVDLEARGGPVVIAAAFPEGG